MVILQAVENWKQRKKLARASNLSVKTIVFIYLLRDTVNGKSCKESNGEVLVYAGLKSGPGHLSRRSGPLRAERSGDRMKEERNFTHQSIRP